MSTLARVAAGGVTCLPSVEQLTPRRHEAPRTKYVPTQGSLVEQRTVGLESTTSDGLLKRRDALAVVAILAAQTLGLKESQAAGLPESVVPKLCDAECEKELENVW